MAVALQFEKKPKAVLLALDSWIMVKRSSMHILRNTDQLLGAFFQPIMFLALFSAVFGGAVKGSLPPGVHYLDFLMAGIIVQTVAFGSTTTAVAICNDLQKGIIDRFRSLPMSNIAVLNGHIISDLLRNTISTTVMLLTGLVIGFRSHAGLVSWLYIAGILMLFTFAFSWMMAIMGVFAKSVEAVQWLSFVVIFPLTFASGAFVPAASMPHYLRLFAENQPITQVVEAVRSLMLGKPVGHYGWLSVVWCLAILAVSMPLASWLFRRKAAQ
ncbi:MAG TPA: ABC transporter permease [Candidatus Saccharimonadales bacterium]|nr:ABC transporter permease [Candidatus Saccharimonadales bacterium]